MAFVPNGGSLNKDVILYFYCQCEDKKGEIDTAFDTEMDENTRGSSENIGSNYQDGLTRNASNEKKQRSEAYDSMADIGDGI